LTEDRPDGRLYRFKPAAYPDLSAGRLQVARVVANGSVVPMATNVLQGTIQWVTVSNGTTGAVRPRPANTTAFNGGEGIWFDHGHIYFTTKGDNRVWRLTTSSRHLCVLYDNDLVGHGPLRGVDNVVVSRAGEVFVAEDGDNMQLHVIREARTVGPLLRIVGQDGSEITGPAFSPGGGRLYFSSQRGVDGAGITYEVRGPFRLTR
nr:PhoX family protein [Actinomycetota bacterium]